MPTGMGAICFACKLLERRDTGPTCKAFPTGIPDRIMYGGFDHRKAFPGDHGVRFSLDEDRVDHLRRYEMAVADLKRMRDEGRKL